MSIRDNPQAAREGWFLLSPAGRVAHLRPYPDQARCGAWFTDPTPASVRTRQCRRCLAMGHRDGNPYAH